jgi:hypothetical protein
MMPRPLLEQLKVIAIIKMLAGSRITELQNSVLLMPKQTSLQTTVEEIADGLQSATACSNGDLRQRNSGTN